MLSFQARKKDDQYLLPVMSYANGGGKIAASGAGSQYANNTSRFMTPITKQYSSPAPKPKTPVYQPYQNTMNSVKKVQTGGYQTPTVKPATPTPKPVVTPPPAATVQTNPMTKLQQIGANRQTFYQKQADDEAARQKGIFEIRSKTLEAQKPELEQRLRNFQDRSNEAIKLQEAQTAQTKQNIYDTRGEEMKLNAQTAREGRGRVQSTLAGLNTLDSNSTGQLLAKAEGNLADKQGRALGNRSAELNDADIQLQNYKLQAGSMVDDEVAKFNQAIRDISANYDINSLEYQTAVKQAYDKAQEQIYTIEESVANKELENQQYYDKLSMDQMAGGKLTDKQAMAQTGLQQIKDVRNFFVQNPNLNKWTKVPGVGRDYDTVITSLTDMIGRMRSGGAINVDEEARFRQLLPNFRDDAASAEYKLGQLDREFSNLLGQNSAGINTLSGMSSGPDPLASFRTSLQPGENIYINSQTGDVIALQQGENVPPGYVKS